jgi:hypothetical protein
MGGGPSKSQINTENQIATEQLNLAREQNASAAEDKARALEYQQPLIAKMKSLAGGDRTEALRAAMPEIEKLSGGYQATKQSIFNTVTPGAARDKIMADVEMQKDVGIASAQAGAVRSAPEVLANVGSGFGAFSLQELGAALSGYGGASSSNQAAGGLETQRSQAKWAPVLGLANAAGGAAGSYFGGKK